MVDYNQIGRNIAWLRAKRNMNQGDLATAANISRTLVSNLERGLAHPNLITLDQIARALDCSLIDDLLYSAVFETDELKRCDACVNNIKGTCIEYDDDIGNVGQCRRFKG